ncbi:DUF305 domain-containing protein [Actinoplanes sp. NPDC049316]|uniref:DUF305 domain-containing protein n=1 Tax=Actinoplanes sp. NPDC049316 TaxID=3154727 RepID=UPI0034418B7C
MFTAGFLRRGVLAGAALAATLVVSACGGDGSSSGSAMDHGAATAASAPAGTAAFNDADVTFAQLMIDHHRQAIQMAALADGRAADPGVKELAATIKAAQQPEIDTMNQWLTAWGKPAPAPGSTMEPGMPGMDHGAMPGMMSAEDMAELTGAKGAAFDKQFLTMMIAHHEGAVQMAQQEAAQGSDPEAKALAQKIVTDQQAEIAEMRKMLEQS